MPAMMRSAASMGSCWLAWESAHWDAWSLGMVAFERLSKGVLHLGPADPAFIAGGKENFMRFAGVLNGRLSDRKWLIEDTPTIADFSVGAWIPAAERLQLPVSKYPYIGRWYERLASLPGWLESRVQS